MMEGGIHFRLHEVGAAADVPFEEDADGDDGKAAEEAYHRRTPVLVIHNPIDEDRWIVREECLGTTEEMLGITDPVEEGFTALEDLPGVGELVDEYPVAVGDGLGVKGAEEDVEEEEDSTEVVTLMDLCELTTTTSFVVVLEEDVMVDFGVVEGLDVPAEEGEEMVVEGSVVVDALMNHRDVLAISCRRVSLLLEKTQIAAFRSEDRHREA